MEEFEVFVNFQGVVLWLLNEDGTADVVMPATSLDLSSPTRDQNGDPVCRHHAHLGFDARHLGSSQELWLAYPLASHRVSFSVDKEAPLDTAGVRNLLPSMSEIVARKCPRYESLEPKIKVDPGSVPVSAVASVSFGAVEGHPHYNGSFYIDDGHGRQLVGEKIYATTLRLRLDKVTRFAVKLDSFSGAGSDKVELHPVDEQVELWIRNFCELTRPAPPDTLRPDDPDLDFRLLYRLRKNEQGLTNEFSRFGSVHLPVPRVASPAGANPAICMGAWETSR